MDKQQTSSRRAGSRRPRFILAVGLVALALLAGTGAAAFRESRAQASAAAPGHSGELKMAPAGR